MMTDTSDDVVFDSDFNEEIHSSLALSKKRYRQNTLRAK
jgi:hypothetical protein